jgi:hypothetical protein
VEPIFTNWPQATRALFGHQPVELEHRLHQHPLFSRDALAELIERYPEGRYMLVHTGAQGSPKKEWRQGRIGKMSGHDVIDAIAQGRMWLNLLHAHEIDKRYRDLIEQIYEEVHEHVPNFPETYRRICGVLISSPRAQVYYHFDTQGNNLWQIAGSKRVYLYPATPPFVTDQLVETISLYHDETSIPYEEWYDQHATMFDLQPGKMLQWALNAPHRIENADELSISMTSEFLTRDIRRHNWMMCGNGLLRQTGLKPHRTTSGAAYYAKAAIFAAAKKTGMLSARRSKPITFDLSEGIPV